MRLDICLTDKFFIKRLFLFIMLAFLLKSEAQETNISTVRDAYLNIASDARAAGQADIGVATSADAFSQLEPKVSRVNA